MAKKKQDAGTSVSGEPPAPYVVLARKYRPQTFDDLIGQEAMVTTLSNAFASERIANGYMLTGVRGIGKTTTARILARALNYETETIDRPTIDMPVLGRHCTEIIESRHPDVVEMDAASNTGVDNIREVIESARYRPLSARMKVYIIDEVHMLSKGAFNALLKTLEEPPGHVKFIFATTEIRKVPVTVLSRCQRFDLRRVDVPRLSQHLAAITTKEGAQADADALAMIARAAEGSVRDALSILDQAIATDRSVTARLVRSMLGLADRGRIFDLLEAIVSGRTADALTALTNLHRDGAEPGQVIGDLAEAVHLATRIKAVGAAAGSEGVPADELRRAGALGEQLSVALLTRAWQMLLKGLEEMARAPDPLAAAEMLVIRLAYTADLPSPDEIIRALGGEAVSARGTAPKGERRPASEPVRAALAAPSSGEAAPAAASVAAEDGPDDPDAWRDELDATELGADERPEAGQGADKAAAPLRTFADVVALAGARRDARLKVHLEEHTSLVRFDPGAGAIDLFLLPGAPSELANDLREKLNRWTGRRWVVMLSKAPGERAIGEVRREREAAEIERLKRHPAVAAVLKSFPDAEIKHVRPLTQDSDDDSATG